MNTPPAVAPDATDTAVTGRLGRGMAVIRILFGVTYLTNGLAKLFDLHRIEIGPYVAYLINRSDARSILDVEVNKNALHKLPLIGRITNDVVLAHWSLFGWGLTAVEIVAGVLLLSGLASRLGALLALGPAVFLFFVYFANDRWLPEQPLALVPLVVLALVPAGRWWGLDRRFADRGWPF
ncbi:MAG: DoxX family membrane protein [Acidimicrobiales bacterium]